MILETLWAALEEMADVRVVGSAPGEKEALACYATPDLRSRCEALGAEKVFDKSNFVACVLCRVMFYVPEGRNPVDPTLKGDAALAAKLYRKPGRR